MSGLWIRWPLGPIAFAALLTATVAASCGRPAARLDADQTVTVVRLALSDQLGLPVETVRCPPSVRVAEGGSFTCRAIVAGLEVAVEVTQVDDEGELEVRPERQVIDTELVASDVARALGESTGREGVRARCPGRQVRLADPGATFDCVADHGDERVTVTVTVGEAPGELTYELP